MGSGLWRMWGLRSILEPQGFCPPLGGGIDIDCTYGGMGIWGVCYQEESHQTGG